jgi:hypothetical protein
VTVFRFIRVPYLILSALSAIVLALLYVPILGFAEPGAEAPNKLTVSYYHFSSGRDGADVNLRHTFKTSTAWVGAYHESEGFNQVRVGYEYDYRHEWLTLAPSALGATHGFLGGSLYSEAGRRIFAIGGAGRTNLRPYWNLSFDPNDYIQLGAGYRDAAGNTISVYSIHDDRLHTGQTNTHIYFRRYLPHEWRLTFDVFREQGHGDGHLMVKAWAESADVDYRRWFTRLAWDPHVNYTADRQFRVAAGLRF